MNFERSEFDLSKIDSQNKTDKMMRVSFLRHLRKVILLNSVVGTKRLAIRCKHSSVYLLCVYEQGRPWRDCAIAQARLGRLCTHIRLVPEHHVLAINLY